MLSLEEMQEEVRENLAAKGWYDEGRPFPIDIALLHSEVSEAFEAYRTWGMEDATDPAVEPNLVTKPEGVGSELADVFIRLLDTCERHGIDLRAEYDRKMAYNVTRPHRHGGKLV